MRSTHTRLLLGFAIGVATTGLLTGAALADTFGLRTNLWPYAPSAKSPVLVTAGDVACQPPYTPDATHCQSGATADEVEALKPDLVAILGDEQYQAGSLSQFEGSFDATWGAFKFIQRPAPGNHEYYIEHGQPAQSGQGYFDYYNGYTKDIQGILTARPAGQAGQTNSGWYSYDLGNWHLISLNAECPIDGAGNCLPDSSFFAQETRWLAQDLAAHHVPCTLAYWHQPLFSAVDPAPSSQGAETKAWWAILYKHGADVILNGHDHVYARWAPMTPSGSVNQDKGIRQFTVGTGGEDHDTLANPLPSNVQVATDSEFGVLKLALHEHAYQWSFLPATVSGQANTLTDSGGGQCHGSAHD